MSSRFPLYIIGIVLFASFFSCTDMVPTKEVRLIDSLTGRRMLIVTEVLILPTNMLMRPIDR